MGRIRWRPAVCSALPLTTMAKKAPRNLERPRRARHPPTIAARIGRRRRRAAATPADARRSAAPRRNPRAARKRNSAARSLLPDVRAARALRARKREKWGLGEKETDRGPYIIELNLQHIGGLTGAAFALREIHWRSPTTDVSPLVPISKTYVRCELTVPEWKRLLGKDGKRAIALAKAAKDAGRSGIDAMQYRAIYKLWPDFPVESQIYRSAPTIKADAASRAYDAAGKGIIWAVIDSGHRRRASAFHFEQHHTLDSAEVFDLHRSFVNAVRDVGGVPIQSPLPDPDQAERRRRPPRADQAASRAGAERRVRPRHARGRDHRRAAPLGPARCARSSASIGSVPMVNPSADSTTSRRGSTSPSSAASRRAAG